MKHSSYASKVSEMTRIALLVAMNCVAAYIIIPLPFSLSPLTLQTLTVNLVGYVLAPKQAFMAMLTYILLGLAGLPVFTGGTAGPGKLFGPTGGYIFGFLAAVTLIAMLKGQTYSFKRFALVGVGVGIPVIYLLGAVQLKLLTNMGWSAIVMTGVLPFIPLDIVKCLAAAFFAGAVYRASGR